MATNLVSQIVEALGPTIVARIASSLGFDQSSTQKAINAAVPGLLAALIRNGFQAAGGIQARRRRGEAASRSAVEPGRRDRWSWTKSLHR